MKFEYSAGAFIFRLNKENEPLFLLLIKENGEYDVPKGHIEKGEHSEEAAIREVKEETGLDISIIPWFSTSTKYFFYFKRKKIFKQVKYFLTKVEKGSVKISKEHKGYEWLSYDEAVEKIKFKDMRRIFPVVLDYIKKYEQITRLNEEYAKCWESNKKWDLSKRFVAGEGPVNASIMLVGQAPGRNEDAQGRPFIGRGGKLLNKLLSKMRIKRNRVYITSIVQFFPPKNRMPTKEEVELCLPYLKKQIEIINPEFVILLGNLASSSVLNIGNVDTNHSKIMERDGRKYMITYHPAAALRFERIHLLMAEDFTKFKEEISKSKQ